MAVSPSALYEPRADRVYGLVFAAWLSSMLLLGGSGYPAPTMQAYFSLSALTVITIACWKLRGGMPSGFLGAGGVLAILSFIVVLLQLVPIPFGQWQSLPGRDVLVRAIDATEARPAFLPLSLDPVATRHAALSLLPPLAGFLGAAAVSRSQLWKVSLVVVACTLVGLVIGLLQKAMGAASGLFFYVDPGTAKYATGTFANRNFFAAQLYTSVPFLAAFAMALANKLQVRPLLTSAFTIVYIGLLIAVLAAVGSRAGIVLAMLSVLLTFAIVFRPAPQRGIRMGAGKGLILFIAGVLVMAQAGMVGILRLAETDQVNEFRSTILSVSLEAAQAQFPFGSGFGTFVPVYQLFESPETIINPYINHAHNEWLEVAIEGGFPALFLAGGFLVWLAYGLFQALRLAPQEPAHAHIRAAGLAAVLLLAHAIVDFPFRTDALLTLLGVCLGLLALATATSDRTPRRYSPPGGSAGDASPRRPAGAFQPSARGFGGPRGAGKRSQNQPRSN